MKIHGGMMKGLIDAFMAVYTDSMKGTIDDGMCGAVFRLSVPSVLIRRGIFPFPSIVSCFRASPTFSLLLHPLLRCRRRRAPQAPPTGFSPRVSPGTFCQLLPFSVACATQNISLQKIRRIQKPIEYPHIQSRQY